MRENQASTGADLGGGGGGRTPPPSGIWPPADPKGPPFDTFSEIHFWPTDPKIFLKAPLAPIYAIFEGENPPPPPRENPRSAPDRARNSFQRTVMMRQPLIITQIRGGTSIFSRGWGGFSKHFRNFFRNFLGRPNWFSELSQSTEKSLIWPKFLRCTQNWIKNCPKRRF